MNSAVPVEVSKAIARLRAEAKEKMRLADELERNYTGEDPRQATILEGRGEGFFPRAALIPEATVDHLVTYLRRKNARPRDLAMVFNVSEEKIREVVSSSEGKLHIPDWRGWVKIKAK